MASAFALTPTASASAYESIVLARRREFGLSSEANSIEGRLYGEAESLALTSAPGEPGAEASDLADLSGSVASKATATENPRVCKSTDSKCVQ